MRGYEYNKYPSDHIILPIDFVNKNGPPAIVRQPVLFLKESTEDFKKLEHDTPTIIYFVAGHYPEISGPALQNPYIQSQSYLVGGHSATQLNLVFHVEYWWDKKDHPKKYDFRFEAHKPYVLKIRYLDENNACYEADIGGLDTFGMNCFKPKWEIPAATPEKDKGTSETNKNSDGCQNKYLWWDYHPVEFGHQNNKQLSGNTAKAYPCEDELQWDKAYIAASNKKK